MSLSIAVVLLSEDAPLSVDALERDLAKRWPELPKPASPEGDELAISLNVGRSVVAVGRMPVPYPWSDLEGPCATSALWPSASHELKAHARHWIVTVSSDATAVRRAMLLTMVTASIVAIVPAAIGVYWGGSTVVLPRDLFIKIAQDTPKEPPLDIWVDFRVGRNDDGTSFGFTQGMAPLGYMDLEACSAPESLLQLRERLHSLAMYLIRDDGRIRHGDTVGQDAEEKVRVSHAPSTHGVEGKVIRLTYETAPKRSSWW